MKKQHVLFSNYYWENDEYGKDHYDYAREAIWESDEEHRFANEDYISDQQSILGVFTCPVCGEEFEIIEDAKECCRDEKWETMDDIPDDRVNRQVYDDEEWAWDEFKYEFGKFIKDSNYGFLLCGDVGTWMGPQAGGCYVNEFNDLYKFWNNCDYIKVYDEGGHLYIKASHHDGSNYAELKELTCAGSEYAGEHYYDSDKEVHEKLWNSTYYTRLPHYAHRVWGCKKGA
jgi:hypothetical protein